MALSWTLAATPTQSNGGSTSQSVAMTAGRIYVAVIHGDTNSTTQVTHTVATTGETWTKRADTMAGNQAVGRSGSVSIWTMVCSSSGTKTVQGSSSHNGVRLAVLEGTGQNASPIGASLSGVGTTTNNSSPTLYTSTAANSFSIVAATDWNALGTPASSDLTIPTGCAGTFTSLISYISGYKDNGATGSKTANLDFAGTSAPDATYCAVEILAAAGTDATPTPSAAAATAAVPAPTLLTSSTVTPSAVAGTATVPAPTVQTGSTVTPTAVAAAAAVPAPTVSTTGNATPTPAAVAATAAVAAPTLLTGSTVTPTTAAAVAAVPSASLITGSTAAVAAVDAVAAVPAPTIDTGAAGGVDTWNLWGDDPPTLTASADDSPVSLGVAFSLTDDTGNPRITGVRYYMDVAETGTPVGALYLNDGTELASADFATDPGTGWIECTFDTPVDVTDTTTIYLAAVWHPQAKYSYTSPFWTADVTSGPLLAGLGGSYNNGRFAYGSSPAAPANNTDANYWVTPILETDAAGATDATPAPASVDSLAAVGTATLTASAVSTPTAVAGAAAVGSPTLLTSSTLTPSAVAAVAAVGSPTVTTTDSATPTPSTAAAVAAVGTATLLTSSKVTPSAVAAVAAVGSPTVQTAGNATATPSTVAATAAVGEFESVTISSTVMPDAVAAVAAVGSPTVQTASSATPTPSAVAAVAAVPAPAVVVGGSAVATPATVAAVAAVPAPLVSVGSKLTPSVVAGFGAVPAAAVFTLAVPQPATVGAVAAVGTPFVSTGQTITPATVAATAAVPAPNIPAQRRIGGLVVGAMRTARGMAVGRMQAVRGIAVGRTRRGGGS